MIKQSAETLTAASDNLLSSTQNILSVQSTTSSLVEQVEREAGKLTECNKELASNVSEFVSTINTIQKVLQSLDSNLIQRQKEFIKLSKINANTLSEISGVLSRLDKTYQKLTDFIQSKTTETGRIKETLEKIDLNLLQTQGRFKELSDATQSSINLTSDVFSNLDHTYHGLVEYISGIDSQAHLLKEILDKLDSNIEHHQQEFKELSQASQMNIAHTTTVFSNLELTYAQLTEYISLKGTESQTLQETLENLNGDLSQNKEMYRELSNANHATLTQTSQIFSNIEESYQQLKNYVLSKEDDTKKLHTINQKTADILDKIIEENLKNQSIVLRRIEKSIESLKIQSKGWTQWIFGKINKE